MTVQYTILIQGTPKNYPQHILLLNNGLRKLYNFCVVSCTRQVLFAMDNNA